MLELMEEKEHYLSLFADFEKSARRERPGWLADLRQAGIERFAERGFPTLREEEWRFTNVAPIARTTFRLAGKEAVDGRHHDLPLAGPAASGPLLVFVNGHFAAELSRPAGLPDGVVVGSLAEAVARRSQAVERDLGRLADLDAHAFVALNTAFFRDGAFIEVPAGVTVPQPIHLLFLDAVAGEPAMANPRNLVRLGAGSHAAIVECYVGRNGAPDGIHFTNAVTEVTLDEGAALDHYKVQRQGQQAFHVGVMGVRQAARSTFASHSITLGGALVRNEVNVLLDGEGCDCTLNGLYRAAGKQLVDNHTRIEHARPSCTSHELYKGILDGQGHGVFNGKIYVRPEAQKTDAKQTNQTLLLSEDAVIHTKPQLEIFADDVKCTHGATVGHLDDTALFYLRSRGVGLDEARRMLIFGFANDIVQRIRIDAVRQQLEEFLWQEQHLVLGHGRREP